MMKTKLYTLIACLFFLNSLLIAQNEFKFRAFDGSRCDFGMSYNFFVGPDAEDFRTTINGFGSGFLDLFSFRASTDVVTLGTRDVFLSLGAGIAISKYKFSENLIISHEDGFVNWEVDPDPSHDYGSGFFSYGKSKLVSTTLTFPVNMNFDVGDFFLSAGITYDRYLTGKLKRKFKVNGSKEKVVVKNDQFNDFPVNRDKLGLGFMVMHKPSGLNIGVTYMTTPYFREGFGPEINEMRISVSYELSRIKH